MAPKINSADLTKSLLYVCGTLLILLGLVAILFDFIPDLRVDEYGGLVVLLIGAVLVIATTVVYTFLPRLHEKQRLEQLRRHYTGRPRGELWNINHNIVDAAQAAILGIELTASFSHECLDEDTPGAACREKIAAGKKSLDQASVDVARMKKFVDELEKYVSIS